MNEYRLLWLVLFWPKPNKTVFRETVLVCHFHNSDHGRQADIGTFRSFKFANTSSTPEYETKWSLISLHLWASKVRWLRRSFHTIIIYPPGTVLYLAVLQVVLQNSSTNWYLVPGGTDLWRCRTSTNQETKKYHLGGDIVLLSMFGDKYKFIVQHTSQPAVSS